MSSLTSKKSLSSYRTYLIRLFVLAFCVLTSAVLGTTLATSTSDMLFKLRLSRAVVALASGASLSVSGVVFQSVFKNPMADPYLLGSSAGASFLVALLALIASAMNFSAVNLYPAAALLGAAAATLITLFLSRSNGRTPIIKLLLTGIAVSFLLGSATPIMLAFTGKDLYTVFFFMNGTTQGKSAAEAIFFLSLVLTGLILVLINSKKIEYLLLGEERSYHIGFEVERAKLLMLLLASYLTGISVAFTGIIGFVGLVMPNLTRNHLEKGALNWVLNSAITGAIYLVIADFASRNLFFPREVPLNSITALIGAPYLIWLVKKNA